MGAAWRFEKRLEAGESREISTPEEIIRVSVCDGIASAVVATGLAKRILEQRGYRAVAPVDDDREAPSLAVKPPPADDLRAMLAGGVRGVLDRLRSGVADDWLGLLIDAEAAGAGRETVLAYARRRRLGVENPLRVTRSPRPGRRSWRECEILADEVLAETAVILVYHGQTELEEAATRAARRSCRAGGAPSPIVVQNREDDCELDVEGVDLVRAPGLGFGASCRAGFEAARARGARWVLFTQSDVAWTIDDLTVAIAAAMAEPGQDGRLPIVGVSGGTVQGWPLPGPVTLSEVGRNVGGLTSTPPGETLPVDWVAGYWIVARVEDVVRAGGWSEDYRLYWEDVDFSFRMAAAGSRPLIAPGLAVNHARGATIRRTLDAATREQIRADSAQTFYDRWVDRVVPLAVVR